MLVSFEISLIYISIVVREATSNTTSMAFNVSTIHFHEIQGGSLFSFGDQKEG